ncbi:MAG: hypothetical protein K9J42_12925 [Sulfuritalea sp.]|nr:hypothetical protein [Sulfuritalea sp.]
MTPVTLLDRKICLIVLVAASVLMLTSTAQAACAAFDAPCKAREAKAAAEKAAAAAAKKAKAAKATVTKTTVKAATAAKTTAVNAANVVKDKGADVAKSLGFGPTQGPCGKAGLRACMVWEHIPTCDLGLIQNFSGDGKCIKPTDAVRRQICKDTVRNINKGMKLGFMDQAMDLVKKEAGKLQPSLKNIGKNSPIYREAEEFVSENMDDTMPEVRRMYTAAQKSDVLIKLFRNADLICGGDIKAINRYLERAGLKPQLPARRAKGKGPSNPPLLCPGKGEEFWEYRVFLKPAIFLLAQGTVGFSYTTNWDYEGAVTFFLGGGSGVVGAASFVPVEGVGITYHAYANPADVLSNRPGIAYAFSLPGVGLELPTAKWGDFTPSGLGISAILGPQVLTGTINATYTWNLYQ